MVLALYVAAQAEDFERWSKTLRLTQHLAQPTPVVQSLAKITLFSGKSGYPANKIYSK